MSFRIRPVKRVRRRVDVRVAAGAAALLAALGGVVAVRVATEDQIPPLSPVSLTRTAVEPVAATNITMSPDGRTVAAGGGDQVVLWDIAARSVVARFRGTTFGPVAALAFVDDGRGVVVGETRSFTVFDVATRTGLWSSSIGVGDFGSFPVHLAAMPGGSAFVAAYPAWFALVEWTSIAGAQERAAHPYGRTRTVSTVTGQDVPIPVDIAVSPDGTVLAEATTTGAVLLFHTGTGELLAQLPGALGLRSVAFNRDGRLLATLAGDAQDQLILWDVGTRSEVRTLRGEPGSSYSAEFHPDGRIVAVGGERDVVLWDSATGAVLATAPTQEQVTDLAFDPTGSRLVTAGPMLTQWDLQQGPTT